MWRAFALVEASMAVMYGESDGAYQQRGPLASWASLQHEG